jgi:Maltokinase N-terminal cap domain
LLSAWLPGRLWFTGRAEVQPPGAYRFDDPAGEVGIEAILLQAADGSVLHAPLTYRRAPLDGAQDYLIGTTEHSVLGRRWVYDGCGDPIWPVRRDEPAPTRARQRSSGPARRPA